MTDFPWTAFIQNAALLLAVAVVLDVATDRFARDAIAAPRYRDAITGVVLGVIGITVLLTPFQLAPGLFFDARGVLLAVAGLFFAPIASGIAMSAMIAVRIVQGGAGAPAGIAVIVAAWLVGVVWRRARAAPLESIGLRELWLLGIASNTVVFVVTAIGLHATVSPATATVALRLIAVPLLAILPVATALLGGLLVNRLRARRLAEANEQLKAEVQAQLEEVRASRVRIVEAGDAERKRVERDLHDGAQQRLVSLTLALRLARARLGKDPDHTLAESLDQASADAKAALTELRELARGIHPQILTEAGLSAAIESLADRAPIPVEVMVGTVGRLPPTVESTAYFVVSEALTNVAKYAQATHATVRVERAAEALEIEVADDGVGGADPAAGTGLRGLVDRLAAVDGTLDVSSPRGAGTRLVARIPMAVPKESLGVSPVGHA